MSDTKPKPYTMKEIERANWGSLDGPSLRATLEERDRLRAQLAAWRGLIGISGDYTEPTFFEHLSDIGRANALKTCLLTSQFETAKEALRLVTKERDEWKARCESAVDLADKAATAANDTADKRDTEKARADALAEALRSARDELSGVDVSFVDSGRRGLAVEILNTALATAPAPSKRTQDEACTCTPVPSGLPGWIRHEGHCARGDGLGREECVACGGSGEEFSANKNADHERCPACAATAPAPSDSATVTTVPAPGYDVVPLPLAEQLENERLLTSVLIEEMGRRQRETDFLRAERNQLREKASKPAPPEVDVADSEEAPSETCPHEWTASTSGGACCARCGIPFKP